MHLRPGPTLALTALCLSITAGCQTNELGTYMAKIDTVGVFISQEKPLIFVDLGRNKGVKKEQSLWAQVADGASGVMGARMQGKLEDIHKTGVLENALMNGFMSQARGLRDIEMVEEEEDADTFVDLRISKLGFHAQSPTKRPNIYLGTQAEMRYAPEKEKLIWDKGHLIDEKLTAEGIKINLPHKIEAKSEGSTRASLKINLPDPSVMEAAAENLSALENLSNEELTDLFGAFAFAAGEKMGNDLAQGK